MEFYTKITLYELKLVKFSVTVSVTVVFKLSKLDLDTAELRKKNKNSTDNVEWLVFSHCHVCNDFVVVLEIVVVLETAKGVRLQVAKSIDPEHESHQNLCMPCPTHNVHVYRQDFVRYLDLLQISSSVFNVQGLACQVSLFKSPLHCSNGAKVRYGTLERCKILTFQLHLSSSLCIHVHTFPCPLCSLRNQKGLPLLRVPKQFSA